jgi:hypothetical protein
MSTPNKKQKESDAALGAAKFEVSVDAYFNVCTM